MQELFDSQVYYNRRKKLINTHLEGIAVFMGNDNSPMNYFDNTYPFRQDSTFLYFFGISIESLAAIIDFDNEETILFGDDRSIDDIVWMGSQPSLIELANKVEINDVRPLKSLYDYLKQAKKKERSVHILPTYRVDTELKLSRLLDISIAELKTAFSIKLIIEVIALREIKSPEEIDEITEAVNISVDMHVNAMQMVRSGMKEAQIAAVVHQTALAAGGDIAFPIIATINGQTLHNHFYGNTLKEGQLFLLDAGAQTGKFYAGDLSTTFPVSAGFTNAQKEIYEISYQSYLAAVHKLREGTKFIDVHKSACMTIIEGMKSLGFMTGDAEEAYEAGAHALFFPCGTGHMLGLDVHDMENLGEKYVGYDQMSRSTQFGLKSLRLVKPLKKGFILTIEPGIYFIPELIDKWKAEKLHTGFLKYSKIETYKNFGGLRLEDNFLITEDSSLLLGKKRPRTVKEIESFRSNNSKAYWV